MGSLNNLYISQSFQSLVHFGSDWTASANLIQLEDGLGNGLGVSLNTNGDISASGDITASNLYAPTISGSNGHFSNGLFVSGTISAYELKVVIESSSIIFTSGSNIIGDEANVDTQTLVGRVINTGSLEVSGSTRIAGDTTITGSLIVNGLVTTPNLATTASNNFIGKEQVTGSVDIKGGLTLNGSSSFTELTGSLADFSQSIDLRILNAAGILQLQSQSVILGLARTLNFSGDDVSISISNQTGSVNVRTGQFATTGSNTFTGIQILSNTASVQFPLQISSGGIEINDVNNDWIIWNRQSNSGLRRDNNADLTLLAQSGSLNILNTAGRVYISGSQTEIAGVDFIPYSTSVNSRLNNTLSSASAYSASAVAIFATTGSNSFVGTEIITGSLIVTGSMIYSGSVRGGVVSMSISSNTASMDCSLGNFFTITLVSGSNTFVNATNVLPGETISLLVNQPSVGFGTETFSSNIKFPISFPYTATPLSASQDILTFVSFGNTLYGVAVNRMV